MWNLKFLGILLMFLWVAYLLKELFFSHRRDPMMDSLSTAVSSMTTAIASNSARMEMLEKRQNELITQQRQDTGLIFLAQSAGQLQHLVQCAVAERSARDLAQHRFVLRVQRFRPARHRVDWRG